MTRRSQRPPRFRRRVLLRDGGLYLIVPNAVLLLAALDLMFFVNPVWALFLLLISAVYTAAIVFFFRNPSRESAADGAHILAGADGVIRTVETIDVPNALGAKSIRISIYLRLLDVHVNRAPIDGTVTELGYTPGRHMLTRLNKASEVNEHSTIRISREGLDCVVRQIVGPVVRRVVHWLSPEDAVLRGEPIGMMKFGSRLDLYLPEEAVEVLVKRGDTVRAGVTPVAVQKTSPAAS